MMNTRNMETERAVAIGASAGAFDALSAILPELPEDFALPVFVVVHVPPRKPSLLAELFGRSCRLPAKEAEDKEPVRGGTIYFAPPDYHLLVEPDFHLSLSSEEPVLHSRPSLDVLFETAARAYGTGLVGVILTGANADGARGLAAVAACGGTALVQTPGSAEAPEMPRAALAASPGATPLQLHEIAAHLQALHRAG